MKTKKEYIKPNVDKIKIDRDISMVMMTPPGDPATGGIFFNSKKKRKS